MKISRIKSPLTVIAILIVILAGCDKKKTTEQSYDTGTHERIIEKMYNNPDSASDYIDAAVRDDSISHEHGDYLHAFYHYYIVKDSKAAESVLNSLNLYFEKHEPKSAEENYVYTDLLLLTAYNYARLSNYSYAQYYAQLASERCRKLHKDAKFIASDMDCLIGLILYQTGKKKESMKMIDEAIAFAESSKRFIALQTMLNCLSYKASILYETDSCKEIIKISNKALKEIQKAETRTHIPKISQQQEEMNRFKEFYSSVFLANKAAAFAKMGEQDSARVLLEQCLNTNWGKTHRYSSCTLFNTYTELGMENELDKCISNYNKFFGNDTVQVIMYDLLKDKAKIAQMNNDFAEAERFSERAFELQNKIFSKEVAEQIAVYEIMSEKQQQETKKREEAEHNRFKWISHSITWSLVVLVLIHYYFHLKKTKQIKEAYQALLNKQSIFDTNLKLFSALSQPAPDKDTILFEKILQLMRTSKPYLKNDFSINTLAEMLNTNTNYISRAIKTSSGRTFPQWLAEYRNHIAIEALQKNPDLSINEICVITGHNNRETFSRQFKEQNGISFTEFKEQNKENSSN